MPTCNRCGEQDLVWGKTKTGHQLGYDSDGRFTPHFCAQRKRPARFESRFFSGSDGRSSKEFRPYRVFLKRKES